MVQDYVLYKQNLPKSPLMTGYLDKFLGDTNIISLEGQKWKSLRSLFNPGFSAMNIMSMADAIVDASLRFRRVLEAKSETNEIFELEEVATRLTIDIIGVATFDVDMDAQFKTHPIVEYFRERVTLMPGAVRFWDYINPMHAFRLWLNNKKLDQAVNVELDAKILRRARDLQDEATGQARRKAKRSIIDLALNAYEKEMALSGTNIAGGDAVRHIVDPRDLPAELRQDIVNSIKTFFFAGHDTTYVVLRSWSSVTDVLSRSSTISWCYYFLHRYPEVQSKLTAELDEVFPPGVSAADKIKEDPYVINKLHYTTAVIKETLRIFPPASTIRAMKPNALNVQTSMIDPRTGQKLPLEGADIWPLPHLINRNRRFFPEPTRFIPERFIPSQTPFPDAELFTPAGKAAFQPFVIGPRNCIGQELAMTESRIILALTVREFDFVLEYPGEEADPQPPIPESIAAEYDEGSEYGKSIRNGQPRRIVEGHRAWSMLKGTAKPNGGCPGRVKVRRGCA